MNAYLVDGVRTPIGKFGGALKSLHATQFAAVVARELLSRNHVEPEGIQRVVTGRVVQDMTESNPARVVGLCIGVPETAAAYTINMQCCSGMAAFMQAAQAVQVGEVDCVLALGLESLSNGTYALPDLRWGARLGGGQVTDILQECSYAGSKMWGNPMAMFDVAENHARVDGITRLEMEEYAVLCHRRTIEAIAGGRFASEVVTVDVNNGSGTVPFAVDEHPRADTSLEALAQLRPIRPNGTVTAGTSSGLSDGAAAALVCNERALGLLGVAPLAKVVPVGTAMVGCDPNLMGYSAVEAVALALRNSGRNLADMDLIECNEGFAVQLIADVRMGEWPMDRVNLDGGSLALGHPVGMSGMRVLVHLAHSLKARNLEQGVSVVPGGSGLGTAVILERTA